MSGSYRDFERPREELRSHLEDLRALPMEGCETRGCDELRRIRPGGQGAALRDRHA